MTSSIKHPQFRCQPCQGTAAPVYHVDHLAGGTVSMVHACEHVVREWYDDAPADLSARLVAPEAACRYPDDDPWRYFAYDDGKPF